MIYREMTTMTYSQLFNQALELLDEQVQKKRMNW